MENINKELQQFLGRKIKSCNATDNRLNIEFEAEKTSTQ